jgi:hypothetical protein
MSSTASRLNRRSALKSLAAAGAGFAAPMVFRAHAGAAPSETLYHASFGTSGMARSDIGSIIASPHVKLVAVADVDLRTAERIKTSATVSGGPGRARRSSGSSRRRIGTPSGRRI